MSAAYHPPQAEQTRRDWRRVLPYCFVALVSTQIAFSFENCARQQSNLEMTVAEASPVRGLSSDVVPRLQDLESRFSSITEQQLIDLTTFINDQVIVDGGEVADRIQSVIEYFGLEYERLEREEGVGRERLDARLRELITEVTEARDSGLSESVAVVETARVVAEVQTLEDDFSDITGNRLLNLIEFLEEDDTDISILPMRLQIEADYFSDSDDNDDVVRLVDELKELRLDIVRKPRSLTLVIRLEVLNRSHAANYIRDRATLVLGPGDTMFKLEVTALGSDQERVLAPRQPLDVPPFRSGPFDQRRGELVLRLTLELGWMERVDVVPAARDDGHS